MYRLIKPIAALFFAFIIWVIYLANTGQINTYFSFYNHLPYGDKIGHFCLFGFLTLCINLALKCRAIQLGRLRIYWGTACVTTFVVAEEFSQKFIPSRTFDLTDLAADAAGISLFTVLSYALAKVIIAPRPIQST